MAPTRPVRPTPPTPPAPRARSLTQRLTLFFTAFAAALVCALGLVFIDAADRHFVDLDRATLQDRQRLVAGAVRASGPGPALQARLAEVVGHHQGLHVRVQDGQGQTLYASPDFPAPPEAGKPSAPSAPSAPTPSAPTAPSAHSAPALQQWTHGSLGLRGLGFAIATESAGAAPLQVLVAVDTLHHDHFLADLRRSLWGFALAAVLASGVLGWAAAHQGLAPLRAMRDRAAAVSDHRASAPMPVDRVPVEMADLAAELNAMLARLQADHRRLSEFSSDLAHELRTPISNLLTQTQVALSARRGADTYRQILASNAEELDRLARMVADMLFLAKAERGMALPHPEPFQAAQEVAALLEFYDAVAEDRRLRLQLQGDARLVGDRLMFRRAVSNLLSNAVRHADPGSTVQVAIAEGDGSVVVGVENQADDIPPQALPRLFDRFFRVDPARGHPEAEGAGLGLSITRAIVEAHGGTVQAHSQGRRVRLEMRFPQPAGGTQIGAVSAS